MLKFSGLSIRIDALVVSLSLSISRLVSRGGGRQDIWLHFSDHETNPYTRIEQTDKEHIQFWYRRGLTWFGLGGILSR